MSQSSKRIMAGMTGLAAMSSFDMPKGYSWGWKPPTHTKETAKKKAKRRVRNKMARKSRKANRGK